MNDGDLIYLVLVAVAIAFLIALIHDDDTFDDSPNSDS